MATKTTQFRTTSYAGFIAGTSLLALVAACSNAGPSAPAESIDIDPPSATVSFSNLSYLDHSQMGIAIEQGWLEDVGITLENANMTAEADQAPSLLASGRFDVVSSSPAHLIAGASSLPDFKQFHIATIFQGFAIMADPDAGYKSFQDFIDEGMTEPDALGAVIGQMRGKIFAYPPETGAKGFIDAAFKKAGLSLDEVETNVAPDPANVALMRAGRADFQTGGVPSVLALEAAGFRSLVTSGDLARLAEGPDDEAVSAVFHDGWVATDEWIEENYDTVLRLSSVGFRINDFIVNNPEEAVAIHVPFLNSLAGTTMATEEALGGYRTLDPFLDFEQQAKIFDDPSSPISARSLVEAQIRPYEREGILPEGQYGYEDFSIAEQVYKDLVDLKEKADTLIQQGEEADLDGEALELLEAAKYHYSIFNYLDAERLATLATS